jgi:hypothetical protein
MKRKAASGTFNGYGEALVFDNGPDFRWRDIDLEPPSHHITEDAEIVESGICFVSIDASFEYRVIDTYIDVATPEISSRPGKTVYLLCDLYRFRDEEAPEQGRYRSGLSIVRMRIEEGIGGRETLDYDSAIGLVVYSDGDYKLEERKILHTFDLIKKGFFGGTQWSSRYVEPA